METPQHGNVSMRKGLKNQFSGISIFFWKIPQNWKMLRDFRIFLRRFLIFKVEVFPLFFRRFRFFWGISVFFKAFPFFQKTFKTLFCWGISFFLRRFRFLKKVWKLYFELRRFLFFLRHFCFFEAFQFLKKNF